MISISCLFHLVGFDKIFLHEYVCFRIIVSIALCIKIPIYFIYIFEGKFCLIQEPRLATPFVYTFKSLHDSPFTCLIFSDKSTVSFSSASQCNIYANLILSFIFRFFLLSIEYISVFFICLLNEVIETLNCWVLCVWKYFDHYFFRSLHVLSTSFSSLRRMPVSINLYSLLLCLLFK